MRADALRAQIESALKNRVPAPFAYFAQTSRTALCGLPEIDRLNSPGGLPRGALTEICGPDSSGRTTVLVSLLAHLTAEGEACALIDSTDAFDPLSARDAGVDLTHLLWTRCRNLNQALRATDLVLAGGGFGLVAIDLGDVPARQARRVPLACWFRFRRVVERSPTLLVLLDRMPCTRSCASMVVDLSPAHASWIRTADRPIALSEQAWHTARLGGTRLHAELACSR